MKQYIRHTHIRSLSAILILVLLISLCGCTLKSKSDINVDNTAETIASESSASDETQESTTETPDPVNINLLMVGDMLMHQPALNSGLQADGTYNYDHLFRHIIDDTASSDMTIANQETILGGTSMGLSSYPCFNSPFELGTSEVRAGFNIILHATNHVMDKGTKGIDNCLNFWRTSHPGTAVLGINDSADDYNNDIYVYQKAGFKVAVLNYTYGTNGINVPSDKYYYVNILDKDKITADVKKAKEIADMVVVCPHWGTEYVYEPDTSVKAWTQLFLELGVDLVIGTHPHVIEPVETLVREDGHRMVVYYSLGNFVSNQDKMPRMIGGMAKVTLTKDSDGVCYISNYKMIPVVTHKIAGPGNITTYKLSDYTEKLAQENGIRNNSGCQEFSLSYCQNLCEKILGSQYNKEKQMIDITLEKPSGR